MPEDDHNHLGQKVDRAVPGWTARRAPEGIVLPGRYCRLEPYDIDRHAARLYAAYSADTEQRMWTYLPRGPFPQLSDYLGLARKAYLGCDPLVYAIIDQATGHPLGQASFMAIDPAHGCIEIGGVIFSPALQRTRAATEAMYLMLRHAFDDLGYRRCAWQCNAFNTASLVAARRLGFTLEGIFRNAAVLKGRNRDTAWHSMLDTEWPQNRDRLERWLAPDNFHDDGRQLARLSELA